MHALLVHNETAGGCAFCDRPKGPKERILVLTGEAGLSVTMCLACYSEIETDVGQLIADNLAEAERARDNGDPH